MKLTSSLKERNVVTAGSENGGTAAWRSSTLGQIIIIIIIANKMYFVCMTKRSSLHKQEFIVVNFRKEFKGGALVFV